jgi:hypothetical protein
LPENVLNAYTNEEIGLLPRGGVALLLEHVAADDKNVKFKKELGLTSDIKCLFQAERYPSLSSVHKLRLASWSNEK